MIKKAFLKAANRFGYEIRHIEKNRFGLALYIELYGRFAAENRRFFNIGAGGFRHPAWTNVDYKSDY